MFADSNRVRELGQPVLQPLQYDFLKRMQVSRDLFRFRLVPLFEFCRQLEKPREPIGTFKTGASFASQICGLLHDVYCGEALPQCFASSRYELGVWKGSDQPNEKPMPVHRGVPVITPIESRRQFPGWCCVGITIQGMANVIWILFVHAGEGKIRKTLSGFGVELTCALGRGTQYKEQGGKDESHRLIL